MNRAHEKPSERGLENSLLSFWFFQFSLSRAEHRGAERTRPADCLSAARFRGARSRNRSMQQASCCQVRRHAKRGAQQSPDCEHPSKLDNTAWRHEAPLHLPVGRRAGYCGTRASSFDYCSATRKKSNFNIKAPDRHNLSGCPIRGDCSRSSGKRGVTHGDDR